MLGHEPVIGLVPLGVELFYGARVLNLASLEFDDVHGLSNEHSTSACNALVGVLALMLQMNESTLIIDEHELDEGVRSGLDAVMERLRSVLLGGGYHFGDSHFDGSPYGATTSVAVDDTPSGTDCYTGEETHCR